MGAESDYGSSEVVYFCDRFADYELALEKLAEWLEISISWPNQRLRSVEFLTEYEYDTKIMYYRVLVRNIKIVS